MSTSSTTHEPDASDDLTDIEKQRPNTISTESLTKEEEKLALSDSAVVQLEVPAHDSIFDEEYPDGGFRAWLIVFGAMCNTFATLVSLFSLLLQVYPRLHIDLL